jgi:hypothetical protein
LKNLDAEMDEISALETIREKFKISKGLGYFELKKHKPWFEEG